MISPFKYFGHWRPQKRRVLAPHLNPGIEVVVVTTGRFTWQVEGVLETLGPGMVFFTLPWQEHGAPDVVMPGCTLSFAVFPLVDGRARSATSMRFHRGLGLGLTRVEERTIFSTLLASRRHALPSSPRLLAALPALVDELQGSADDRRIQVAALATQVVAELARVVRVASAERRSEPAADQRVRTLLAEVTAHCDRPWALAGMARRCGLGRTRFAKLVERETGDSPITHLLRLRVKRMQTLLRSGQSVTASAIASGFSSSQYAARVFRAFAGGPPSTFAR